MNKESEKLAKQLGVSKSDCLKLEWQEFVEKQIWQGEDEHTKNMGVGNAADWWLEKIHQALAEDRERVRGEIEKLETDVYAEREYLCISKEEVMGILNKLTK